jgi:hypothetical protein
MTAFSGWREQWAIEMGAYDPCSAGILAVKVSAQLQELMVITPAGYSASGCQSSCAMSGMAAANRLEGCRCAIHEVGSIATVDVQIEQTGAYVGASHIDHLGGWKRNLPYCGDPSVFPADVPWCQAGGQNKRGVC